jgi:predicted nucleic-acid-binding Zn-ribbon protein
MKCPKCGSGQGDIFIPIDKGALAKEVYQYCDECGYEEELNTTALMKIFLEYGHESKLEGEKVGGGKE